VPIRSSVCAVFALLVSVSASASQYPMLDMVAQKVIARYEQSTCEQLWEARGKPKPPEVQEMLQILQGDPQMRTVFINEVAGPVANKMFECGLIP
jgi:succinyl-CoA synthetase beta subunit